MTRLTRRSLLLAAATSPLAAPSLRAQPSQIAGDVTLAGFFGITEDKYTEAVLVPFRERYPNIRVTYRAFRNSAEGIALLRLNRTRPTVDVAMLDVSVALLAAREQLYTAMDPALVPNLADLPDWAKPVGTTLAALTLDNLAIVYNGREVRTPPTSWNGLGDPALRGRLVLPIADTRGVLLLAILAQMAGVDYKTSIDAGIEKLKQFAPLVQTWDPQPDVYTVIRSGQAAMGVAWNGRGQYTRDVSNGEVGVSLPEEGSIAQVNMIGLATTSPAKPAAQALLNYALSPEAQARFAAAIYYGPTNSKVTLPRELDLRIFGTPEARARSRHLDWVWLADRYGPWVQRIRREVIAG